MPRLVFAVTVAMTAQAFLRGQAAALAARGWKVDIVCSPYDGTDSFERLHDLPGVTVHPLTMNRAFSPIADLRAWVAWRRLLKRLAPDVVIASTPKASLLAIRAARYAGVPNRIFHVRGLRSESLRGVLGALTRWSERAAARAATDVLVDSPSLLKAMRDAQLLAPEQGRVLGQGSCCGVDVDWFRPPSSIERQRAREALGLIDQDISVGFIGRITPDKGVRELVDAAVAARGQDSRIRLTLIGPREDGNSLNDVLELLSQAPWGRQLAQTSDPRAALWGMDVFVLPSYREGFPISALEAQACGVPVITTDSTGCVDSVLAGRSGITVPSRDVNSLTEAVLDIARDRERRVAMGREGRAWMVETFSREVVEQRILGYIEEMVDFNSAEVEEEHA